VEGRAIPERLDRVAAEVYKCLPESQSTSAIQFSFFYYFPWGSPPQTPPISQAPASQKSASGFCIYASIFQEARDRLFGGRRPTYWGMSGGAQPPPQEFVLSLFVSPPSWTEEWLLPKTPITGKRNFTLVDKEMPHYEMASWYDILKTCLKVDSPGIVLPCVEVVANPHSSMLHTT
jgi:hypothetical protein